MNGRKFSLFNIKGKSILVTGATGYLGSELSISLAHQGAHVYVNSRTLTKCKELVSLIESNGGKATVACFDVTNRNEIEKFAEEVDIIDVIVNNSYSGAGGNIKSSTEEDYLNSYKSSIVASSNLLQLLLPSLRKAVIINGYASIINISSMYGLVSPDQRIYDSVEGTNPPFYGAAKSALIQWTKYAACEFAKEKIRINCISPGPFPSDIAQKKSPGLISEIVKKVPMGRFGKPSELVGPVIFLSSTASSFMSGTNLTVDGGWTCW